MNVPERDESAAAEQGLDKGWEPKELTRVSAALALSESATADDRIHAANVLIQSRLPGQPFDPTGSTYFSGKNPDPVAFYDYARKVFEIGPESILTPEYKELMAAQDDEEKVLGIAKSKLGPFRRVVEKIGDLTEDPFAPLTDEELRLADDETKAAHQILADNRRYRLEAQSAYSSRRMPTDVRPPTVDAGTPEFKAAAEKVAKHRQNVKDRGTIAEYQSKVLADNVWYQYQLVKDKLAPDTDEIVRMAFSSKTLTPAMADKFRNLKDGDQQRLAASLIYGAKLRGDKALLRDAGREFAATLIDVPKDAFESLFVDSVKRLVMDDAQYQKQAETAALLAEAEAPRMAEYGYWGDAVIGFAATIPYMGYAMIPKIGTGMIAAKAAKDFEERVAASGGDVTSGEFQAAKWSSAIAYAALEKMQALRIGGPITDLQKRQAFLHFWRKANAGIVARTVVGNTAAETWQEGVQKAVEDGFVAYGLGQDVARNAAMGLVQELKDASGTMFLTSLSGVGVQAVRSRATRNHTLSEIISGSLHASALIDAHRNNDAEAIAKHRAALASLSRQVRDAGSTQNAIDQLVKQGVDEVDATVLTTFLENEARMIRKDAGLTEDQKEELIGKERTAVEVMQDLMPDARVEANAGADGTPDGTFTIRRTVAGTETVTRVVPVENVQFDLSTPESAASALKRLNEYGANLTTEAWNGMTEDEKRQILAQKGISKASAWRFESPSGQGVTDGQLKVLTGEIQIARGMEPSTIFHEYFHGMVKYLTETKALAPADVAKLREEFGPPAEGVDEQFNEENAADRFKDYAAKKVHFTQSSALEKVWEAAADLLSKAKELVFRTKQAQPTIDEAMFEQVISGEYTGIPVATVRKSKEKAQETPAPDATPAQDEPEAGTKPDTAPAEIPPANANVGPNPAKPPASHGGMNLDGLKAKDQQKVDAKGAKLEIPAGEWRSRTPKGEMIVGGHIAIMPNSAIVNSFHDNYHQPFQNRGRDSLESRIQINRIKEDPHPDELLSAPTTDSGSPKVHPMHAPAGMYTVISGNGRERAMEEMAQEGTYEERLGYAVRHHAQKLGMDLAGIDNPTYVEVIDWVQYPNGERKEPTEEDLVLLAKYSNKDKILAMNESEQAENDAKMIVAKGMIKLFAPGIGGNIMALSNAQFMTAFIRATDASNLVNSDGHPTDLAERRVKRALLALLIGEGENARQIIRSLTENAQEMGMGTVVDGVLKSIGDIVGISQAKPSLSIVDATGMALRDYLEMKIAGFTNAQNWVNQGDLFNTRPQAVASLVQAFAARANTSIGIAAIFRDYAAKARIVDVSTGSLGLANVDTMESLLDKAIADTASEAEADAKAQASPTPADADKATVPPPPPVAKRQEEAKADKQEDEERQPPPRTSLAIQPGQTPFAEIGKGQKAVPTKDAPETKWKLGIPLFMGAKRGLADRATAAIRRLLSKRQREAVKTVWDGFGGSGGWGLYHALENFTNADTISIGEYDLNRMEKIKFFHAKGDKLGEVINSPAFVSIRRDIVRAMVSRQDASAAQPTLNLGVEQAQPVKQELTSAGTLANRAQEILDARIKAGELNSADVIAAVQAIIDTANNGRQQGADTASEMFDEIERIAIRDAAEIFKSAQAFRARGGKIEYRPERDTYETAIPAGNSVFVLLDPPYYLTQDYDPDNPGKKVGIDTYRRTRDIVRRAVSQGNGILYTDSAWWLDNKANAEAGLTVPEDHQIVVDIYNELDHFDVVDGKVGDRHEAIGVHHGRQGTETERRSRDGVAGPAVQQEADGRIHQPGGTGTPADQDLPGMAEGTPGQAGPVRSEDDRGADKPRLTFDRTGPLDRNVAAAVIKSRDGLGAMEEDELKEAIARNDPLLPYQVLHYWNTIGFTEIADNSNPEITQAFEDALARIPPTSLPGMTLYRYQGYQTAQARAAYLKGIKPGAYIEIQRPTNAFSRHMSYGQEMADAFGGRFVVQFVVESPRQGRDLGVLLQNGRPGGEYLYRRGDRFRVASVENGKHGEKVVRLEESSRVGRKDAARFSFEYKPRHEGFDMGVAIPSQIETNTRLKQDARKVRMMYVRTGGGKINTAKLNKQTVADDFVRVVLVPDRNIMYFPDVGMNDIDHGNFASQVAGNRNPDIYTVRGIMSLKDKSIIFYDLESAADEIAQGWDISRMRTAATIRGNKSIAERINVTIDGTPVTIEWEDIYEVLGGPRFSFARMRPEVSGNSAAIASLAVQKLAGKEIGTEQAARAMYLFKPEGATADQLLAEANKMADGAIGQAAKRALESADPTKAMTIIAANAEMQAAVAARAGAVEGAATALRMGKTAARGEAAAMKQLLIAAKGENLQQFEMDTGISWTETLLSFLPEKWKQWEDDAKKGDQVQGPQKPVDAPEPPKATEQELAEREKRMGQLIEAAQAWDAQRRAKLEKERDDKKAEDAKEGAGGETEQTDEAEEAAIPAIPRELLEAHGVDLTSPEAIAHAIRLWIGDWIVRNSDGRLTPETVWKDPEAVEMYRKTIRQQLEDMAAKLLDPSDSGPVFVARMIGDLPRTGRPDTFERRTALILASIQAHAIRQSRRELVKGIRKTIDDMAKQGKKFDPMEEDLKRKVSAEPEKIALYIKQYIGWGADKCHAELEKLQAQIEARQKIYDEQHGSLDATADVQLNYDQIKLAMLARWGNLKSMLPAEIKAAGEEITAWLSSEQERLQRDWFRQAEANSGMMTAILEGVVPTDPEKAKQEPGAVQQFVEAHTYMVRQRLEALLRHGNPAKRAAAMKAIEEVMFQMSRGTEVYEATRLKYRKQWDDAVIDATRGMDGKANRKAAAEWVKHLDEPIPAEISNAVSRQGYRGTMTYGQAIQLYVGLTQRFYADNVLRNKRGDHAAKIRSILTPADLKMVARMRDIYEQRRAELSAVVRKVTGLDVWRPDPLYMPVQMYLGSRGGLGTAGSVRAWKSLSDALTPRVRNNRDFDESVDIQSMFYQRMEDTARAIGYGARGLTIRGVLGKKDLHDVVERYYGKQTVAELMKHVTQVMAGVQRHGEGSVESTLAMIRKANTYMALSYNLLSMAKQIGSVPAFMFKLGTGEFVTAIGQYDSASWAELKDSDGFKARYMGGIAPEVMEILDDPGQSKLKRAYKAGMVTVQAGDYLAAKIVATGIYKAKVAQLSNKGMPIELAKERAKTETWSIVEETQQSGRTENVSGVYRNYGEMAKLIFQFASAPLMQLSHEYHAAMDAKAGVPGAKERLVRAVLLNHVIIPGIMSTIAWAFNSLLLGDEPPEDRDTILEVVAQNLMFEPLSRILIVGSVMEALGNSILKGKLPGFSNDVPASRLARTVGYAGRSVHDLFTMDVEQFQADILELAKQASAPVRHVSTLIENRIAE